MSVLDEVMASLRAMEQWQLLLAFVACTAYVLAQGELVSVRARRIAWGVALVASIGFAFESAQWVHAAMLTTFAIAGLGLFVAGAWLISHLLGFSKPRAAAEAAAFAASVEAEDTDFPATIAQPAPPAQPV